jgi:hypothetical protein
MATPADQRLLELLDKWLKSLELHARYSSLDDESYWKVQPWVEHQRPSRWVVDVAKQKTLALRAQLEERIKKGDAQFADSMELMIFLANLVGSEHIERFIPLAEPTAERPLTGSAPEAAASTSASGTREMPKFQDSASATATREMPQVGASGTREMPQFLQAKAPSPPPPEATSTVVRTERKTTLTPKPARGGKPPAKSAGKSKGESGGSSESRDQVIADAQRLVQWGRKWYELPELIARMADRPSLPEVRRILKENKAAIEKP